MTTSMKKKDSLKEPYNPKTVDTQNQHGFPTNSTSEKEPFCIIMPPPNNTGILHMGHALVTTIQDILVRAHRMDNYEVLWVPGTDHAGIATQSVVEKKLFKETGKKRTDFNRDEFVSHIKKWNNTHKDKITSQIKRMGASANWPKQRFTLDETSTRSVKEMFKKLYDDGLIYRGDYLVNWDTQLQTALADDEVEHEEKDSFLWYFNYPIENSSETITIATTRPETMLGDTAVAVNGSDERYKHLVGKNIILPLSERLIPIIKDHYVDKEFGTGAVKITPGHDFNDYEIGNRHHLPIINIMNEDGTINENGGNFKGMTMLEARGDVVERMRDLNLLEKVEAHKHRVGISYRSKSIIEPFLSKQWFLKMEHFKSDLLSAINDKKIEIIPKEWEKTYKHWIENIRDWCISRQLWWGHRIPIWYDKENPDHTICHIDDTLPEEVKKNPDRYIQEEDVLDTWFSSALWPLTCLGWPDNTDDIKKFYPTSILVTGHDILFFWVARMILMGQYGGGDIPFKKVFLHGLIFARSYWRRDETGYIHYLDKSEWMQYERGEKIPNDVSYKWEKMSKSKGNIINPEDIIDEYGADALRLALTSSVTTSKQIDLDYRKFEEGRHFANKLWNASSFVIHNIFDDIQGEYDEQKLLLEDRWILSQFSSLTKKYSDAIKETHLADLVSILYNFFWNDFCSYYIEISKPYLYDKVDDQTLIRNKKWILLKLLTGIIQFLHPIIPFITEEIFQILKQECKDLHFPENKSINIIKIILSHKGCAFSSIQKPSIEDTEAINTFNKLQETLHAIRNIRQETNIPPGEKIELHIEEEDNVIENNKSILFALTKISSIDFHEEIPVTTDPSSSVSLPHCKIVIMIPKHLIEKEKLRLEKSLEKTIKNLEKLKNQLSNKNFIDKAPQHLIDEKKESLATLEVNRKEINEKLKSL